VSILVELPPDQYDRQAFATFNQASTDFDPGVARAMMWMSQLAYETHVPDTVTEVAGFWGLSGVTTLIQPVRSTLPLTDTRGIVARKGDATIVAFAGTDPLHLLNWVSDFSLGRPKASVHAGFEDAAAVVWPDVRTALTAARATNSPIFITGHSLGAAIAVVTADFARQQLGLADAQVYLYGCPRVGRDDFVGPFNRTFGKTTYRLVHGADVVPTVPPPNLGFHHVGRYLTCASGGKFNAARLTPDVGSDEPMANAGIGEQLVSLFRGRSQNTRNDAVGQLTALLPVGIGDHLPDRYYAALTPV
jgi:hypothetical protein